MARRVSAATDPSFFFMFVFVELLLAIYPSTHLPIYPSTHLPIYPSTHLPIYPSTHLSQRCTQEPFVGRNCVFHTMAAQCRRNIDEA